MNDEFDEDDFGDFGGFEEADPVEPQEALPMVVPGAEASPSPWAMFPGPQPDLIQPRPSNHANNVEFLTTPQEDILGARAAGASYNNDNKTSTLANHQFSLSLENVNDEPILPPVGGLDQPCGLPDLGQPEHQAQHNVHQPSVPDVSQVNTNPTKPDLTPNQNVGLPSNIAFADSASNNLVENSLLVTKESKATPSIPVINGHLETSESKSSPSDNLSACKQNHVKELKTSQDRNDHKKLEKELGTVLSQVAQLEEVLLTCQEELQTQKDRYHLLQTKHSEELENLRKAGHDTLAVVVEEYKELSKTAVLEQKQINEQRLKTVLEEQSKLNTQVIEKHEHLLDFKYEDERNKMETSMKELLEEERQKYKVMIEETVKEEQQKLQAIMQKQIEEEKERLQNKMESDLAAERKKASQFLEEERKKYEILIEKERTASIEMVQSSVETEMKKCQNSIRSAIQEEQEKFTGIIEELKTTAKEDLREQLKQQQENEASSRRHLLAATDLFLDSARKQIGLLLNDTKHDKPDST